MTQTNTQLVAAWKEGKAVPLPYFDNKEVELFFDDEEEVMHFAGAIQNFLALTQIDRATATRHLWAYFKDHTDDVGFEGVEAGLENLPKGSERIWQFVTPITITAVEAWDVGNRDTLRKFVILEANCGWEMEHGLSMSWRDGSELVKVSGYDGHATNGHAYDDLSKDAFVYYASNPEMCTKP